MVGMKDYRLTVKVRNNRILKAIEGSGGNPGQKWCEAHGLSYAVVNALINMTCSPLSADGNLRSGAAKLCDVLEKLPDELWSNEQLYPLEKNFSEIEMDVAQAASMIPRYHQEALPDFSEVEQEKVRALITKVVSTLTDREQSVIRMRFYEDCTLEECGKNLGVSPERIRQIEAKALRKMRKPGRIGMLVDTMDFSEEEIARYKRASIE